MTHGELVEIAKNISFNGEWFEVMSKDDGFLIQLRYYEEDVDPPHEVTEQHARKWYVSSYSTESEVVRTCLKACLTSYEHRCREHFLYKGKRIFGPHIDVNMLLSLAPALWEDHRKDERIKKQ